MSVPKLKVTILRDNDAVQKAWLEVKDHGYDLRLYSQQYGTTVDWEKPIVAKLISQAEKELAKENAEWIHN